MTSNVGQTLGDIFSETSDVRTLNPITGILGNVSGHVALRDGVTYLEMQDQ